MDRILQLEKEISDLRKTLNEKENELYQIKKEWIAHNHQPQSQLCDDVNVMKSTKIQLCDKLPKWAIERYSRQILLPDIGVRGQERLCAAKVLVVGAGGLGCPAAVYLAGAGVGGIGIVDYDTVEMTNIHRQILHTERDVFMSKAESAAEYLRSINSRVKVTAYCIQLTSKNAIEVATKYDIVLDCSDNVPTRYLLNDLCAIIKRPLISGSALKMEGQLTIYGYRADEEQNDKYRGPCYRCVFPSPPPAEAVGSCSANGVAGPVCGVIGVLQALEAIKYLVGQSHTGLLVERMLLFDGEDTSFRTVKLRARNPECPACSEHATITHLIDYEMFCQAQAKEKDLDLQILPPQNRITPTELASEMDGRERHLLVDVRSAPEFAMCSIDGAVNRPLETLRGDTLVELLEEIRKCTSQVTFICRRGNDSQIAAKKVLDAIEREQSGKIKDLAGGLHAWSKHVDTDFPVY